MTTKTSNSLPRAILGPVYRLAIWSLRGVIRLSRRLMGQNQFIKATHYLKEGLDWNLKAGDLVFDCAEPIPLHRATHLFEKEPETINWIDTLMQEDDVLYDVGANIGIYSLYAAISRGCRVYAFEPASNNYALLNRNIALNDLSEKITALNFALHDDLVINTLNLSRLAVGSALHTFVGTTNGWGNDYDPVFRQGVIGVPMDKLVTDFNLPFPNFIKIDVDGNEHIVINGMSKIIADPRLKSIAIELNFQDRSELDGKIADQLRDAGFEPLTDESFDNQHRLTMKNYFFHRA